MLFFGVEGYTTNPGSSRSLWVISPVLYAGVAALSVAFAAYVAWRHRHWAWAATSMAVILCLPRYFAYELSFLFVGLVPVVDAWRRREAKGGP
jgi:hypothetical protein